MLTVQRACRGPAAESELFSSPGQLFRDFLKWRTDESVAGTHESFVRIPRCSKVFYACKDRQGKKVPVSRFSS